MQELGEKQFSLLLILNLSFHGESVGVREEGGNVVSRLSVTCSAL